MPASPPGPHLPPETGPLRERGLAMSSGLTLTGIYCSHGRRPLRTPFRTALREVLDLDVVRVEVAWSDGSRTAAEVSPVAPVTGETVGSVVAALTGPLADAVKGVPLADHEDLLRRLRRALPGNTTAKCALDLAVHEALGNLVARAVSQNGVGAPSLAGIATYLGTSLRPVRSDMTISLDKPGTMATEALARTAEGFDVLKLKLGGGGPALEVERVASVARAVGPAVTLRLDANQAWTPKEALAVLDGLEKAGVRPELLEQPVPAHDMAGMATVARHGSVPVLADEAVHSAADVVSVAEAGAADLVNVKLAKCGGLRAARDVIAVANACQLGVVVGCMLEPASALRAGALLAMTLPVGSAHDLDALWWVEGEDAANLVPPMVAVAP